MDLKTMKAIVLEGPFKMVVKELPIPQPADGQVLIKVMAAPINPSDLFLLKEGTYEQKKAPCTPGFEGSGMVVASGGGFIGWTLVNKKVAFTPAPHSGSYAQYAIAKATQCLAVDEQMTFQHASMSFINPLTAMALLDYAKTKKTKTVIINAAASALGKMLNRLLPTEEIDVINIVRKEEQVQVLRKEGANYIINSSEGDFEERLKEMATKMNAFVCFDAIGGDMTGRMLNCMPKHSTVYVYGALDGPHVKNIDAKTFIYRNATVTGFFLPYWLEGKSFLSKIPMVMKLKKLLKNELKSEIALEFSLEDFEESAKWYIKNMTKGKVILKPHTEVKPKDKVQSQQKEEILQKNVQSEKKQEKLQEKVQNQQIQGKPKEGQSNEEVKE